MGLFPSLWNTGIENVLCIICDQWKDLSIILAVSWPKAKQNKKQIRTPRRWQLFKNPKSLNKLNSKLKTDTCKGTKDNMKYIKDLLF